MILLLERPKVDNPRGTDNSRGGNVAAILARLDERQAQQHLQIRDDVSELRQLVQVALSKTNVDLELLRKTMLEQEKRIYVLEDRNSWVWRIAVGLGGISAVCVDLGLRLFGFFGRR
jgi:hypothetical protein